LLLVGVTGLSQQAATVLTVNISVTTSSPGGVSISFSPNSATLVTGSKILWINQSNTQVILSSTLLGFQVNLLPQGNFSYLFQTAGTSSVTASAGSGSATMAINVTTTTAPAQSQPLPQQPTPVLTTGGLQEFALIYDIANRKIYPLTITVRAGIRVRFDNTAINGFQSNVLISSDPDGTNPAFGVQSFEAASGMVRTVDFTPDQAGTYYITERPFGNDIVGTLIVVAGS
jgi:hypothetical protein